METNAFDDEIEVRVRRDENGDWHKPKTIEEFLFHMSQVYMHTVQFHGWLVTIMPEKARVNLIFIQHWLEAEDFLEFSAVTDLIRHKLETLEPTIQCREATPVTLKEIKRMAGLAAVKQKQDERLDDFYPCTYLYRSCVKCAGTQSGLFTGSVDDSYLLEQGFTKEDGAETGRMTIEWQDGLGRKITEEYERVKYLKRYVGAFGVCDYDSRIFEECVNGSITYLHYKDSAPTDIPFELPNGYFSCFRLFYECTIPEDFKVSENFSTRGVKNMELMFGYTTFSKLPSLGDGFELTTGTNIVDMFYQSEAPCVDGWNSMNVLTKLRLLGARGTISVKIR